MPDSQSLTERRHNQTRREIVDAAIALFTTHGYAPTTMDDVAVAAGTSRRTAYRHFPNKAELLFEHPRVWLTRFDEIVASREPTESLRELCHRGLIAVAHTIQDDRDSIVATYAIVEANEDLQGRRGMAQAEWGKRYAELLTPEIDTSSDGGLLVATIASVLVGCTNALVATWYRTQPHADMPAMTQTVIDHIDSIWPPSTR